jgi:hypothetical protein
MGKEAIMLVKLLCWLGFHNAVEVWTGFLLAPIGFRCTRCRKLFVPDGCGGYMVVSDDIAKEADNA